MLSTITWPQAALGLGSMMGLVGVVLTAWHRISTRRNGNPPNPSRLPPPRAFPCPRHSAELRAHDHELAELKRTDEQQWKAITEQGKLQAEMNGTLKGMAKNVDRLVENLL